MKFMIVEEEIQEDHLEDTEKDRTQDPQIHMREDPEDLTERDHTILEAQNKETEEEDLTLEKTIDIIEDLIEINMMTEDREETDPHHLIRTLKKEKHLLKTLMDLK